MIDQVTNFDFSTLIKTKDNKDGNTYYSARSDEAKRQIAVVAALQILNSHAPSAQGANIISTFNIHLPKMTQAILDALEGK